MAIADLVVQAPPAIARGRRLVREFAVRGEVVRALDQVDIDIVPGALTAISGPSGSGKSTLLALLGCIDRPDAGTVELAGRDVAALSRRARRRMRRTTVAMMLPHPSDNLLLGRTGHANIGIAARQRGADPALAADTVDQLRIGSFVGRHCMAMSGGEQQRVALACALAGGTALVLADEPTGALDQASAGDVIAALRRATETGATIVTATHDPNLIAASDAVIRLEHGRRLA